MNNYFVFDTSDEMHDLCYFEDGKEKLKEISKKALDKTLSGASKIYKTIKEMDEKDKKLLADASRVYEEQFPEVLKLKENLYIQKSYKEKMLSSERYYDEVRKEVKHVDTIYSNSKRVCVVTYETKRVYYKDSNKPTFDDTTRFNETIKFINPDWKKHADYFTMLLIKKSFYIHSNWKDIAKKILKKYGKEEINPKSVSEYTEDEKISMKLAIYEKADQGVLSIEKRDRLLHILSK